MIEYIARDEILKYPIRINHYDKEHGNEDFVLGIECVIEYIEQIPAADVQPVKHGRWISEYIGYGVTRYKCSVCGGIFGEDMIVDFQHNNFCSDCGAKMTRKDD